MKQRLDSLVVQHGLAPSRDRAKRLILAGQIYVDGQRATKAGRLYQEHVQPELRGSDIPFVGRGGLKLAKALDIFQLDTAGKTVLDIGASTGGFTDCLLQRGADYVYAVDVGRGQMSQKLREDPRVCVMEQTNARYLRSEMFDRPIHLICADVSFISLTLIMEAACRLIIPKTPAIVLFKPQFEAGRRSVSHGGVVKDPGIHKRLLMEKPMQWSGWYVRALTYSPITGPAGNIEYLLYLSATDPENGSTRTHLPDEWEQRVNSTVEEAHRTLITNQPAR